MDMSDHVPSDRTDANRLSLETAGAPRFGFLDHTNPRYAVPAWATLDGLARPVETCALSALLPQRRTPSAPRGAIRALIAFALMGQVAYASQEAIPNIASLFC